MPVAQLPIGFVQTLHLHMQELVPLYHSVLCRRSHLVVKKGSWSHLSFNLTTPGGDGHHHLIEAPAKEIEGCKVRVMFYSYRRAFGFRLMWLGSIGHYSKMYVLHIFQVNHDTPTPILRWEWEEVCQNQCAKEEKIVGLIID